MHKDRTDQKGFRYESGAADWNASITFQLRAGIVLRGKLGEVAHELQLSERELQVMHGIFEGHKHSTIAATMQISVHTVDSHWRHLQIKLGVKGRVDAIHRIAEALFQMRLDTVVAPLEQMIAELQRQVNQLASQVQGLVKQLALEKPTSLS